MNSIKTSQVPKTKVKRVETSPYVVDRTRMNRFNSRNTIFDMVLWDSSWEGHMKMYDEAVPVLVSEEKPGYSRVYCALSYASWIVHDAFKGGFSRKKIKPHRNPVATIGIDWTKTRHKVKDPCKMGLLVKRAATRARSVRTYLSNLTIFIKTILLLRPSELE